VSYRVHVHWASDWFDSDVRPIPREDWDAHVAEQEDLVAGRDGIVRWTGHPDGRDVRLEWELGRVSADEPDEATLARLAALADELAAIVQGDDCEHYDRAGRPVDETDDALAYRGHLAPSPPRATSRADFLRGLLRRE